MHTSAPADLRRKACLAITLAAVALLATFPAETAAEPPDASGALERWHVTQQVVNESPYRLELVSARLTELTEWDVSPSRQIGPGERSVMSFYTDEPGHGLVGITTYAAVDVQTEAFVGMVSARSGVDCNLSTPIACLRFHRWEELVCDGGEAVRGYWVDNGADPGDFWTEIRVVDGRGGAGACAPGWGAGAPPPEGPAGVDDGDNQIWGVTTSAANLTPYVLRARNIWNSESTSFQKLPPTQLRSGITYHPAWMFSNSASGHGPAAVVWYDLHETSGAYIGSALFETGVDCVATYITEGCLSATAWQAAAVRTTPGHSARTSADGFGLPPLAHQTDFVLIGGPMEAGPAPPVDEPADAVAPGEAAVASEGAGVEVRPAFTG